MQGDNNSKILRSENTNCAGCGMSIMHNLIGDAIGNNVKYVIPACCGIVTAHSFPYSGYKVPVLASTFAASSAVAAGLKAVQEMNNEKGHVIVIAGDGGTFDIGMGTMSASAERQEDIIYICYDNEIYGNTGAQRSGATPFGARTVTTPHGKKEKKKAIMSIMSAHNIPYAATCNIAYPNDFKKKLRIATDIKGFRFIHVLAPCIPNWKMEPSNTIKLSRLATESAIFPLYEVFNNKEYRVSYKPDKLIPIDEYLKLQKRFSIINDEKRIEIQKDTVESWKHLLRLEEIFPPGTMCQKFQ